MASADLSPRYQPGDRVRIAGDVITTATLPGYIGVVKEVIVSFADNTIGYNTSLEDDPRPGRVWFFFQEQLKPA